MNFIKLFSGKAVSERRKTFQRLLRLESLEDRKLLASVSLTPLKDNTLYQTAAGSVSSGAGNSLAFGLDHNDNLAMRGLIDFDVAGQVPAGATITSVTLTVWNNLTFSNSTPNVELHRVTSDWGEGASAPTRFMPPYGAAKTNDATWLNTFYPSKTWTTPGGDFVPTVSGTVAIGADNKSYTWGSTTGMVADVQGWLNNPSTNFGWLIKGDETRESGKMIDSKESTTAAHRPTLTIQYTPAASAPDLTITKIHTGNFRQGDQADVYTITVGNAGAGATSGVVTVTDVLPAGLTARSVSGTGWTTNIVGATVTATRSDVLAGGNSYPILTITVGVATNAPATVTNLAHVAGGGELNTSNDSASDITIVDGIADLAINKTHSTGFQQGDTSDNYLLTVSNVGPGATLGQVTVTDALPVGLIAKSASGSGWTAQINGSTITATRSDVLNSSFSYPTLTVTVGVANDAPTSITNTAVVSGGGESNSLNDSSSDVTTISSVADLTITKSHSDSFRQGDTQHNFTLTVRNQGVSATQGTVTVVDTIPAGLTAISASGAGWTTSIIGSTFTATRSDAIAGSTSYPVITVACSVSATAAPSIVNTAMVSGGGEINTSNDSASDTIAITQVADLTITKTHSGSFEQGSSGGRYLINVKNSGVGPTTGQVTVTDTLPAGLTPIAAIGTGWTTNIVGSRLTATRSDTLAVGASYPELVVTVSIASSAATSVTNIAEVTGGGEINGNNDSASDPTVITAPAPDLVITKTHSGSFRQGDTADAYTLTVQNSGSLATKGGVTIVDTLPAGLVATTAVGSGWQTTIVRSTVTATRSDVLNSSASYPVLTLTVSVANDAPATITNTASVSGGGELNTTNDSASDSTSIAQAGDVTVSSSHASNFRQGDTASVYSVRVQNVGAGPTSGVVTVTDTLPAGLIPTLSVGSGWTTSIQGSTVTETRSDSLAAGASYPALSITVSVSNTASASLTNSVQVTGGGELNTTNNSATDPTTVALASDLTIAKTHAEAFRQGDAADSYSIIVSNAADAGATQGTVTVTDTIPTGMTAVSVTGTGWTTNIVGSVVTATRTDVLASGSSYPTLTISVKIAGNSPTSVTNTAQVAGGGELNVTNDSASDITSITPTADLTITKTHSGVFKQGDTADTYDITVANAGSAVTSGTVTVTDSLPAGLAATAATGNGWVTSIVGNVVTATRSDVLAAGANYPALTINVSVASTAASSLVNTAQVVGGGELFTTNDSASDTTNIESASGSLTGYVYLDASNAGKRIQSNGQLMHGVAGITVTLQIQDSQGNWSNASGTSSFTTGSDGSYHFNNLIVGTYRIAMKLPKMFLDGIASAGQVNGTTKGTTGTDKITIQLASGENGAEYDFSVGGMQPTVCSRRWSLASTASIDQVFQELMSIDKNK